MVPRQIQVDLRSGVSSSLTSDSTALPHHKDEVTTIDGQVVSYNVSHHGELSASTRGMTSEAFAGYAQFEFTGQLWRGHRQACVCETLTSCKGERS